MSATRLAAALALCLAPSAHTRLRDAQDRTLTADDGTTFLVTSGIVRVPEERTGAAPSSATIDLAVVRVRRAGATTAGAHVVLAGGPGDSGTELVLGMARQGGAALSDLIAGDYVGIDQRGTGRSSPSLASDVLYDLPPRDAGSLATWLPAMERASRAVAATLRARGIRLEAYNTRESADDVDDVRRALGYGRVTLWGRSYGSHLALATLRQHPGTVERLVLVGPEGPNHTFKLPTRADGVLQRVAERAGLPELPDQIRQVLARLARKPVLVAAQHPLTGQPTPVSIGVFDVQWLTADALGDPRYIATLPAAYREMVAGNFQRTAALVLMRRSRLGVESAMKHMMDLSSGATAERRAQIERETETALLGNAINFPGMYVGAAWGASDLGDAFREPVKSDVPTLILVGDLDPRTPVENAREIAATLPNGRVVVVENATHRFDVFGSAEVRAVLARFLRDARVDEQRVTLPALPFQK